MRFAQFTVLALTITAFICGASSLWAQSSPSDLYTDLSQSSEKSYSIRTRNGKNPAALKTGDGLTFERISQDLGSISAVAKDGSGTLYIADRNSGRLWRLRDRNKDGRYEFKQALPQRFDTPSGLAISGTTIYLADRNAVWVMNGTKPPRKLAGLLNSDSKGIYHPLSLSSDGKTLYLGLSTKSGEAKLLQLDTQSGEAVLIQKKSTEHQIVDLAAFGNESPWLALEHGIGASLDRITNIPTAQSLAALALPLSLSAANEKTWPASLANHVIVTRQSQDGYDVLALPVGLGQIELRGRIIFSGFMNTSGRSVWGTPGPLVLDTQGLIVADSKNGDIYHLRTDPDRTSIANLQKTPSVNVSETQSDENLSSTEPPQMRVSTIEQGSQIGAVSILERGSGLEVGSTIIRDYEPLSLDKEKDQKETPERSGTTPENERD